MGKEDISLRALVQDSNGAVRQVISSDPNAIGYISLGLVNEQVKALRIRGSSPIWRTFTTASIRWSGLFCLSLVENRLEKQKSFIDFVLSPQAQKLLLKEGLVPIIEKLG